MTKPLFITDNSGNHKILCPHCDDEYMQHKKIEVFQRQEDALEGLHITVSDFVHTDNCLDSNPSKRRGGIIIHFGCEGCNVTSTLNFAQHKGITFVEMLEEQHHHD